MPSFTDREITIPPRPLQTPFILQEEKTKQMNGLHNGF